MVIDENHREKDNPGKNASSWFGNLLSLPRMALTGYQRRKALRGNLRTEEHLAASAASLRRKIRTAIVFV